MPLGLSKHQHISVTDGKEKMPRVGLWDRSLKQDRRVVRKLVAGAFGMITLSMFAFLPIYFGAYYRQTSNASRITVMIVDLDSAASALSSSPLSPSYNTSSYTALLGPLITSAAQALLQRAGHTNSTSWALGYQFPSSELLSQFSLPLKTASGQVEYTQGVNVSEWAMESVLQQDVFGVVVVNGNATMAALDAAAAGGSSYDPTGAVTVYYEEARNFYSTNQYLAAQVSSLLSSALSEANVKLALLLLQQAAGGVGGGLTYLTIADPAAVSGAFGYNEHNLRPFDQLSATAPTTAGAIYLIIFTFLISPAWKAIFTPLRSKLTMGSEVFLKLSVPILAYFWISLMYSLVSLAFHVDFARKYGHIGFFIYWLMNWVTMTGLGLVMETMLEILGMMYFPFFLIFWVILNVSVAFLDIADEAHFYSYGFAFPVWNSVDAAKSIMFGTKNHLVQNFVVNLGWAISFGVILACLTIYQRASANRKALQGKQIEGQRQSEKHAQTVS